MKQASQEAPEEVVVRGRRVGQLRSEVEAARRRAYDLFNDINTNDEFDVRCRKESRPGTNVPAEICRAQFENDISADAATEYMSTLFRFCPVDASGFPDTQACMFSEPGVSATGYPRLVRSKSAVRRGARTPRRLILHLKRISS